MSHTSNGVVESKLGEVASLVGRVEDLVVEDGEVEGQSKANGVGRGKVSLSDLGGSLVSLEGSIGRALAVVANGELGKVTVVVTLPIKRDVESEPCSRSLFIAIPDGIQQ